MQFRKSHFTLSSTLAIRYPQNTDSLREEDCSVLAVRWPYIALIAFLQASTLFQTSMDIPTMFCPFRVREGSGSVYFRGFAGHYTIRRRSSRVTIPC
jgi:hypothetical protein